MFLVTQCENIIEPISCFYVNGCPIQYIQLLILKVDVYVCTRFIMFLPMKSIPCVTHISWKDLIDLNGENYNLHRSSCLHLQYHHTCQDILEVPGEVYVELGRKDTGTMAENEMFKKCFD